MKKVLILEIIIAFLLSISVAVADTEYVSDCKQLYGSGKTYILTNNVSGTGGEFCFGTLGASDIVFDCNGYAINGPGGYGIFFIGVTNGTVKNCIVTGYYGCIYTFGGTSDNFFNNTVYGCDEGFLAYRNGGHTYSDNNVYQNYDGFWLSDVYNTLIYHNNVVDNIHQVFLSNGNWYNPTLLEGNYWSDYTGLDDGSGTGKHSIAGDGIGDTNLPYNANGNMLGGGDYYPFTNPSGWLDSDNDGVPNTEDKCPNTVGSQIVYGCSCNQILGFKPGNSKGEYKYGCSQGTIDVFTKQIGWAKGLFK